VTVRVLFFFQTRRGLGGAHVTPTKVFRRLTGSVNKTIVKPRVAAAVDRKTIFKTTPRCSDQYVYVGFSQSKILHSMAITIAEKAIQFRHPDYNPDRDQKLISSSTSRHLSTRNISSKSMHAFLSNLVNGQTDRQTDRQTNAFTSSFVRGKKAADTIQQFQCHSNAALLYLTHRYQKCTQEKTDTRS